MREKTIKSARSIVVLLALFLPEVARAYDFDACTDSLDPAAAVEGCTATLQKHWANPAQVAMILNNRGSAHVLLGEFDKAIDDFNRAIDLDPDYARAHYNRASAYLGKLDYQSATADLSKAIHLKQDYMEALHNRGFVH